MPKLITLSLLITSLLSCPIMHAMEAALNLVTKDGKSIAVTKSRANSLKAHAAEIIMQQLLTGSIDAQTAETKLPSDLLELVKERLLYQHLLYFTHLFMPLGQDRFKDSKKINIFVKAWSRDGSLLLPTQEYKDSTAQLFDFSQKYLLPVTLKGHTLGINSIAFSENGRYVLTGSNDATARLWDLSQNPVSSIVLKGHTNAVTSVALNPDCTKALTCSYDNSVRLWNLEQDPVTCCVLQNNQDEMHLVAFSKDGKYAAAGGPFKALIWDLKESPRLCTCLRHPPLEEVLSIDFSHDGTQILTGTSHGAVRLWDLVTKKFDYVKYEQLRHATILLPPQEYMLSDSVRSVEFSADGRYALTALQHSKTLLWDLHRKTFIDFPPDDVGLVRSAIFSPGDKTISVHHDRMTSYGYPFYSIASKLSLQQILLLIHAQSDKTIAYALRAACNPLLTINSSIEDLSVHAKAALAKDDPITAIAASFSIDIRTLLSNHNFDKPYELKAETLRPPARQPEHRYNNWAGTY